METELSLENPEQAGPHTRVTGVVPLAALGDEEFGKLVSSVLVIIPHRGDEGVHPGICKHFGIWGRIGLQYGILRDPHGGFVEIVRGHTERVFLDTADANPKVRTLVLIDNDQAIEWDTPLRLAAHDKDIVSGVVCGFNPERGVFACFTSYDPKGVPRFPSYRFTKKFPGTGLKRVHQTGAGLLAIKREVFETLIERGHCGFMIDEALRRDSYRTGVIKQGEDFSFSDKAREAGFEIWVDFSVRALHYKTIAIGWPEELVDDDLDAKDWEVSSLDFRGLKHLVK